MTTTSSGWRKAVTPAKKMLDQRIVVKVKHLLGVIVVLFIVFGMMAWQQRSLVNADRARDLAAVSFTSFQARQDAYQTAVAQYDTCLARIETRDAVRNRFLASADTNRLMIDAISVDNPDSPVIQALYDIVELEIEGIQNELPSLPQDTCPSNPPKPPSLEGND